MRASVSRVTSSAGTLTSISRVVLSAVSVGLTVYLSRCEFKEGARGASNEKGGSTPRENSATPVGMAAELCGVAETGKCAAKEKRKGTRLPFRQSVASYHSSFIALR